VIEAIIFIIADIVGLVYSMKLVQALKYFPNEDPRISIWRLPIFPTLVWSFIAVIPFLFGLGLTSNKNLLNIYPNLFDTYVLLLKLIFILVSATSIYVSFRFGWSIKKRVG
jgi:hypothetical protein